MSQPLQDDEMNKDELIALLEMTLERENELLRTYVIASERIHNNAALKLRLINFAEGNAKRTKQLIDEISILKS
ncbi:hypothetical protein FHS18_003234 [Paenibacillus phyllosphaerae]|uniref:Uncharacterized protein n=1 Tax=Paenibacillus phyllosphaerae TaxID=274593 RepID=A0A7W5AZJ7_9BACL|nr:hypothetical protein [Paenibacillus phyllosphaerae]